MARAMLALLAIAVLRPPAALAIQTRVIGVGGRLGSTPLTNSSSVRQILINHDDASYTAEMVVGGQKLQAILDSGSFETLVFGKQCWICGDGANLFDESKSPTYVRGPGLSQEHSFGSGSMSSLAAADNVSFGDMTVSDMDFWQVYDAKMPILLEDSSFQAIVGVGPPLSALYLAEGELARTTEDQQAADGDDRETNKLQRFAEHAEQVVAYTKEERGLVERFGVDTFSICLNPGSGKSGAFIWGDDAPATKASLFTTVPAVGDFYWSTEMTDVRLAAEPGDSSAPPVSIGCPKNATCSAVLDTGTSLIVAPWSAASSIDNMVQEWGGDCSDLSDLPDLEFELGGVQLSLPPSSYVGELCGETQDWDDDLRRLMSHNEKRKGPFSKKKSSSSKTSKPKSDCTCVAMIMSEEMWSSDNSQQWILGLPFFRKYYTAFQFGEPNISSTPASRRRRRRGVAASAGRPVAKSFSFSLADKDCNPTSETKLTRHLHTEVPALKIAASGLRGPSWLPRAKVTAEGGRAGGQDAL